MPNERVFDLTIRAAEMNDAAALAQLMCELGYETSAAEMRERLESILSDARCRTFIGEIDNQICGMVGTLMHVSHEHNDLSGKIIALLVLKELRRSGIGRALLAAAEKDIANRGVRRVSLTTRFAREDAHKFYRGRLSQYRLSIRKGALTITTRSPIGSTASFTRLRKSRSFSCW